VSVGFDSIRILAVDDHPMFRSGIAALVTTQPRGKFGRTSEGGDLMFLLAETPIQGNKQAFVLYLYTDELTALREHTCSRMASRYRRSIGTPTWKAAKSLFLIRLRRFRRPVGHG
jgi:hypothetical protein